MTVTEINTDTFLTDTIIFFRDSILNNITDPISSARADDEKFVMTEYPNRRVAYPIITVVDNNSSFSRLGMRSTSMRGDMRVEVRIWAKTVKAKDELTQQLINHFRSDQFAGVKYSDVAGFHDYDIISAINVDSPGEEGIKGKQIIVGGLIVIGQ